MMPFIMLDMQFSNAERGQILSAFATGYALTQVVGGIIADRFGAKGPLSLALLAVSVGSMIAPWAAGAGVLSLWLNYFLMGLLEGPSYPSIGSLLGKWFPSTEKATANSIASTGGSVGGLLAMGLGPLMAQALGWQKAMLMLGGISIAFAVLWLYCGADKPASCDWISRGELQYLQQSGVTGALSGGNSVTAAKAFPFRLFRFPAVLAVCYAHAVFNFGRYFVYAWIPTYYAKHLAVTPASAAACMTCLQVADACIKMIVSPIADSFLSSERITLLQLRKLLSCLGFLGFALSMFGCSLVGEVQSEGGVATSMWNTQVMLMTGLLTFAKGCSSLHTPGFQTNYLDLSVRDTGVICGVGNTFATVSSMLAPLIAGYVIEHYSWGAMFQLVCAVNVSGMVVFGVYAGATCLDEPANKKE